MTNFNGNNAPSIRGNHARRDDILATAQPFDIDGSVAASVAEAVSGAKKARSRTFLTGFAGAAMACMLALGINGAVINPATAEAANSPAPVTQAALATSGDATLAETVAAKCLPSVVFVETYANAGGQLQALGTGSGVVMTQDGYLITNNHVVDGGSAFKVTIAGTTYDAELVGTDPSSDVAVLKAKDASGLTPMEIGDSDNLNVGEWVMTLGAPFGLEQSVATGIVSATSRSQIMDASESLQSGGSGETTIYPNMIQTDAAINPGNSGGAMVDSDGKLIGINTLITSYSGNYSGVGFAIPANYAVNLANQIIAGETPTHAQLGVSLSSVNDQMAGNFGLASESGAYVAGVAEDSGAAAAGLQEGDIITALNGEAVESASDLMLAVRGEQPGDTVTLTVNRNGQEQEMQVTLGDDAASQKAAAEAQEQQEQQMPENGYGYGYGQDGGNSYGYGDQYGQDGRGLNLDDLFGQR
ncbi:trypsin-like peptidase domain-containing protein [Eggerthellaceae bacterium 24-137]